MTPVLAVTMYLGQGFGTLFHGSDPSEASAGLRVYVAQPDYLAAMKRRAMRIGSTDESDAVILACASGLLTFEAMIAVLRTSFPNDPPDAGLSLASWRIH